MTATFYIWNENQKIILLGQAFVKFFIKGQPTET